EIYAREGFRTVSGEGGHPYGLDKYSKAFFVAWEYQHRAALGQPQATFKELAAKEGVSARFSEHIYDVMGKRNLGYPSSEVAARFHKFPAPGSDLKASEAEARNAAKDLQLFTTRWPSWLFARGDEAFGGAGDESPLVFTDTSLKADPSHHFTYIAAQRRGRGGRGAAPAGDAKLGVYMNIAAVTSDESVKPLVIWRNPMVTVRKGFGRGAPPPMPAVTEGAGAAAASAAALKAQAQASGPKVPLKEFLGAGAAKLNFGVSPDGTPIGPGDFATEGAQAGFELELPKGAAAMVFEADATIGKDREHVIRITFSNRPDGPPPGIPIHAMIGDMQSAGYKKFKAGVLELVDLLPPRSNTEATPADKDPPPAPFDPTYNTPEHDAFDNNVKYVRDDRFIVEHMLDDATRTKLNQAWDDVFYAFDYHDQYLQLLAAHYNFTLKSRKMADLTPAEIAAMPADMQRYVKPLRSQYLEAMAAEAAAKPRHIEDCLDFASRAWRRPLTEREKDSLRAFYRQTMAAEQDHTKAIKALLTRILVSPEFLYRVEEPIDTAAAKPLSPYELAARMSYMIWSSVPDAELRRAAAAGELSTPDQLKIQVKRMLADPKARRMSAEFFGQWLGYRDFLKQEAVNRQA
ncbi:MAG: DUF1592 domain-containing protein, partial [Acidobacteriota bacterium]|nr:DUF1592 domain-containing protein [Acidobacteriota bacterium]